MVEFFPLLIAAAVGVAVGAVAATVFAPKCKYGYRRTFSFVKEEEEIVFPKEVCLKFKNNSDPTLKGRVKFDNDLDKVVTVVFANEGPFPHTGNPDNPIRGTYVIQAGDKVHTLDVDMDPGSSTANWDFVVTVPDGGGGQTEIDPRVKVKR